MSVTSNHRASRGFTLIEVLVTLVILVFGMLGLAGLILKGNRAAFEAYQRHQAIAIANEMAERVKSNQAMQVAGGSNIEIMSGAIPITYVNQAPLATPLGGPGLAQWSAIGFGITDCGAVLAVCSRAQLVQYDTAIWEGLLAGVTERNTITATQRLGGLISARGCIEGPLAAPNPPNTYRISVTWQGDVATVIPTASTCGTGLYTDTSGAINDATRRLVALDVTVFEPI